MALHKDKVILVNEKDEWIGLAGKLEAHRLGLLHRAISIIILNDRDEMLLQQRAGGKYHSGGLWTNACCSHPAPGESTLAAAHRRLGEELGFDTPLERLTMVRYTAPVGAGLSENEFDHVYTGRYSGAVHPAGEEVQDYKFMDLEAIRQWMDREPGAFTAWFPVLLKHWDERQVLLATAAL